jgi:hypothetical protein
MPRSAAIGADMSLAACRYDLPTPPEELMKNTLMTAVFAALALLAGQAFAANAQCDAQATEKKLAGAAKTSFLKKCEADAAGPAAAACEKTAAEKKLAGAAKTSFMKKCEADAGGAPNAEATCDKAATEKKLAGAAKASFVKKCVADAAPPAKK